MHTILLVCLALAAAVHPALGQDALRGKRLYHEVGRLSGAGVSCIDCHGGLPGALHGIGRVGDDPARIDYAIGAVTQMTPLRGRLSRQDMADLAAYVARPAVPSPEPRVSTSGAASLPYMPDRLEFAGAATGMVRLSNAGAVALRLDARPALAGEHAPRFAIAEATCAEGLVLGEGESCTVTIAFVPDAGPGLRLAVLRLAHDWIGGATSVPLIGRLSP
ncbi:MAG: hypothetical protein JNL04_24455 [Rhodospirillaceae bacterium]|nr:hypothetical protein [Rhodospirillaceae bacterium]